MMCFYDKFTEEELLLIGFYDTGTRRPTIENIVRMTEFLKPDEKELRSLAESAIKKCEALSDREYDELPVLPFLSSLDHLFPSNSQ